jgi:low temperature requirement protein LtrA
MKKKLLFLILLGVIVLSLPNLVFGADLATILTNVKQFAWDVFAVIVVVMWIVTGVLYLVAMGAPEKLTTAKRALIAAVVGTAIGILAGSMQTIIENSIIKGGEGGGAAEAGAD